MLHKLQYISQGSSPEAHIQNIQAVLHAGVKFIQLRLKNIRDDRYLTFAIIAKELCAKFDAVLVINDSPRVAKLSDADAVHLGLGDMNVSEARKIFPNKIIGGTANTLDDVKQRCLEQVDYIGLGPYRFTNTKEKLSPVLGATGYQTIMNQMKEEHLKTPVYAIGGISFEDIEGIIKTGVSGIAASGLLTHAENIEQLVKEINNILYHA
jgi:thiamine-phosphate pyrophosphorylase